jgi:hypothetical protein
MKTLRGISMEGLIIRSHKMIETGWKKNLDRKNLITENDNNS